MQQIEILYAHEDDLHPVGQTAHCVIAARASVTVVRHVEHLAAVAKVQHAADDLFDRLTGVTDDLRKARSDALKAKRRAFIAKRAHASAYQELKSTADNLAAALQAEQEHSKALRQELSTLEITAARQNLQIVRQSNVQTYVADGLRAIKQNRSTAVGLLKADANASIYFAHVEAEQRRGWLKTLLQTVVDNGGLHSTGEAGAAIEALICEALKDD